MKIKRGTINIMNKYSIISTCQNLVRRARMFKVFIPIVYVWCHESSATQLVICFTAVDGESSVFVVIGMFTFNSVDNFSYS